MTTPFRAPCPVRGSGPRRPMDVSAHVRARPKAPGAHGVCRSARKTSRWILAVASGEVQKRRGQQGNGNRTPPGSRASPHCRPRLAIGRGALPAREVEGSASACRLLHTSSGGAQEPPGRANTQRGRRFAHTPVTSARQPATRSNPERLCHVSQSVHRRHLRLRHLRWRQAPNPRRLRRDDYVSDAGARAIVTADFDRNGWLDLAQANLNRNSVTILLNQRHATLTRDLDVAVGVGPFALATGDFNRDAIPDWRSLTRTATR